MEEKKEKKKFRLWKQTLVVLLLIVIALGTVFYAFQNTTYDYVQVVKTYENKSTNNGNYIEYADGVLEYSRDGIAMLTEKGEELWNQPCQMSNPMAEICKNTAVVADKGGTNIYVFQRDGLKGEIQSTRPIEKVAVSAQGIVAAILQDEETPRVMCYDAKGNLLVEHKTSLTNTGYPVAIDLSQDGNVLLVSYLCTRGNSVVTRVSFYYFGENGAEKEDYQVAQKEYADTVIPTVAFVDSNTSLLISDQALILYDGLETPEEKQVITLDKEIQSVAYDDQYIALVLKNSGETGHELRMYRMNGKQMMSVEIEGEYTDIKVSNGQVLLYDENKCVIYNNTGVCKFEGTLEMNVLDLFPVAGLNKYMVISANGFQEIQLAK